MFYFACGGCCFSNSKILTCSCPSAVIIMAKARFEAYANTQQQDTAKGLPKMVGHLLYLVIFFLIGHSIAQEAVDNRQCELLKASLTYTQEEAPRDLSGLVSSFVQMIVEGSIDI